MKKVLLIVAPMLFLFSHAFADVYVEGYYRKDGTYVAPYHRSSPNNTKLDNYSTKGNVNPYTGKEGTVDPYSDSYGFNSDNENKDD